MAHIPWYSGTKFSYYSCVYSQYEIYSTSVYQYVCTHTVYLYTHIDIELCVLTEFIKHYAYFL